MTRDDFVQRMVSAVPEVEAVVAEHYEDFDEPLLHLLIPLFRDMAIAAFESGNKDLSARIVAVVDEALRGGDEYVDNAVSVSFVEDTPWYDEERAEFIASWPPALQEEVERQKEGWNTHRSDS